MLKNSLLLIVIFFTKLSLNFIFIFLFKKYSNIFKDGEVDKSNMQKRHIANSDKPVAFYSLDVILAVGYRTNSKTAIEFRKWATQRLKDYLIKGFAVNENRIKEYQENLVELRKTIKLIQDSVESKELSTHESKGFLSIITNYTHSFILLRIKFA